MTAIELIATAPMGLESIVAREVRELGYEEVKVDNGRVMFIGDELAICRANLWLRTADRVLVKMDRFDDSTPLAITDSDIDGSAIEVAQAACKAAGLAGELTFRKLPVAEAAPRGDYGLLITNPPYGERLGDRAQAEKAVRELGRLYDRLPTWTAFVLSPSKQLEHWMGRRSDKNRKLFNGRIECHLHMYLGPLPPRTPDGHAAAADAVPHRGG